MRRYSINNELTNNNFPSYNFNDKMLNFNNPIIWKNADNIMTVHQHIKSIKYLHNNYNLPFIDIFFYKLFKNENYPKNVHVFI